MSHYVTDALVIVHQAINGYPVTSELPDYENSARNVITFNLRSAVTRQQDPLELLMDMLSDYITEVPAGLLKEDQEYTVVSATRCIQDIRDVLDQAGIELTAKLRPLPGNHL